MSLMPMAPAEEEIDLAGPADREEAPVLEEERPLLGKQQVEPRQVDLLFVHFHLREVGVVGQIERRARGDADLAVDSPVPVLVVLVWDELAKFRLVEPRT